MFHSSLRREIHTRMSPPPPPPPPLPLRPPRRLRPASSPNSKSDSAQQKPRLNRLAIPFPDPSLATQIQLPILLSQPLPLPVQYQRPMEHLEIRRHYRLLCTLQQHSSSKDWRGHPDGSGLLAPNSWGGALHTAGSPKIQFALWGIKTCLRIYRSISTVGAIHSHWLRVLSSLLCCRL